MANLFKQKYIAMQETWRDNGITSKKQRILVHLDAIFGDHAFFRVFWTNLNRLSDNAWRCNQPSPRQIKRLSKLGVTTIVNLRGPSRWGSYALEKEACAKYGIELVNHRMFSRRMPTFEELLKTKAMFESLNGVTAFHCKSGADRAGICSALYCLMVLQQPIEQAQKQLSIKYLHIKHSKTGRLDYFLDAYRQYNEVTPVDFLEWAEHHYDRDALQEKFHSNKWYDFIVDKVLRRE